MLHPVFFQYMWDLLPDTPVSVRHTTDSIDRRDRPCVVIYFDIFAKSETKND